MIDLELANTADEIVNEYLEITPDDEVLVLTDVKRLSIARSVAIAARATGATTLVSIMPLLENQNQEPPRMVSKNMETADVAITATTHSITHTDAFRNAGETRIGVLRSVTEEMMTQGAMTADYADLRRDTETVADLLEASDHVHVTSKRGMDVEFDIKERPSFSLDGYLHNRDKYGLIAQFPPGEAPIAPVEGTTNGTIVVDVSFDELGKLDSEITLEIEDGRVINVHGGDQATELREIIAQGDENADNIAEFAIGTNPKAGLIGNIAEDKKKEGTVHFAVGDNKSMGGEIGSDIHLDGVVNEPTVEIDGQVVLNNGQVDWETIL